MIHFYIDMNKLQEYTNLVDNFSKAKIGVIGDIVADISVFGRPIKLSREAPVIVMQHEVETLKPGGAGNTVNNISKLDAKVYPVCIVGDDDPGNKLVNYFSKDKNVNIDGFFKNSLNNTITKTRIMAGDIHTTKQQVLRIDKEPKHSIPVELEKKIIKHVEEVDKKVDVWVVSDYGYTVMTPNILKKIMEIAQSKVVVVDSRKRLKEYKGVTIVAPNESEAELATGILIDEDNTIFTVGEKLLNEMEVSSLLITRGNRGMVLFERCGNIKKIPISGTKEVTDVTGAGDTVTSILAIAYASGSTPVQSAILSNYGAAVVVMKSGTATLSRSELIEMVKTDLQEN